MQTSKRLSSNLLPTMIFVMLLPHKATAFKQLGPKLLISFFMSTLTLSLAFVLVIVMIGLGEDALTIFMPLAGSWMGGTGNMLSVYHAIGANESDLGITMLIDSINYTLWLVFLLFIVPLAPWFNRWTQAHSLKDDLRISQACAMRFSLRAYLMLLITALIVSGLSQIIGSVMAEYAFGSAGTWSVLLATISGITLAYSPLAKIKGLQSTANGMLYLLVALIASRAVLTLNMDLIHYIIVGGLILIIHGVLMLLAAKLFKLDLFSISVASLSHIGGIASAPILSAAYAQSLVGVGVVMATMGYVIGTFVALGLWEFLSWLL